MQRIVFKIYLKNKRQPLFTVDVDSADVLDKLYADLNANRVVKFGQVLFTTDEFRYATIEYK